MLKMKYKLQIFLKIIIILIATCSCERDSEVGPVNPKNQAPKFRDYSDTTITAGDTLRLQVIAHDPEDDPIIYELFIAPMTGPGLAIAELDTATGDFWFAAQRSDIPLRWFGFFAYDDKGNKGSMDIFVTVIQ
jgi:hypothetical protein